ncbi:hypothetical protein D2V17_14200 [Aurantiacibacter xanthus]|uniref:Uncharacterized protein n=1 Tax=Aurantiacibacter xanthus TaxID=1784712 RepID=A0A3A1P312_9SPHN|nr:hypothetical protein [Aurantiacibacter xanthus]RIV82950.1 hypothetical protein D2V17_14200 [Aurantiacibacter xanthus]
MFVVTKGNPTFSHIVPVMVPVDGGHDEQTFTARFEVIDHEELQAINREKGELGMVKAVWKGWGDDLVGEDKKTPVPYSDNLRDQLAGKSYVSAAVLQTYLKAVSKTRVGN